MKMDSFLGISANEKPLDNIKENGGFTAIFRSIGCVGDSLSSGELEVFDKNGNKVFFDLFEHSWGQYIARMTGAKVYNFSRGGMTAKEYTESFAENNGFWNPEYACDAYIIALGVNDLINAGWETGNLKSLDLTDYNNNKPDFAGYFAKIVSRLKEISPRAKFFFVTMPEQNDEPKKQTAAAHAALMYDFAGLFANSYVIDLRKYAPCYDEDFKQKFFCNGHMNTAGYYLTAVMIASYIDYIIRSDFKSFKENGLKNMPYNTEFIK